jgi:hypothetical protein
MTDVPTWKVVLKDRRHEGVPIDPNTQKAIANALLRLARIAGSGHGGSDNQPAFPPAPYRYRHVITMSLTAVFKSFPGVFPYGEFMRLMNLVPKDEPFDPVRWKS